MSMSDLNDRAESVRKREEATKKGKELKSKDKEFEQFNDDILHYLHVKFPDESDAVIQEAAAFISYRTATVILEEKTKMNDTLVKFYGDTTLKTIDLIGGMMK